MLATFLRKHRGAFWQFTGMALIASMVLFGGPAAVLAQAATSSTTTDQVTGQAGNTATASTTDTDTTSTSSVVSVGDNGVSTSTSQNSHTSTSTPSNASSTDGVPALVDTGDATSTASAVGAANTGVTQTGSSSASTTVANDSTLAASTTASSTAQTGSNGASDSDGAGVKTGTASSFGALISLFNIVVTNSAGQLIFLQNPLGGVDLTSQIMGAFSSESSSTASTSSCTLLSCDSPYGSLTAVTTGGADVTNTLLVRSGTGLNTVESTDGAALVESGDASAFGSIINIGNLQIIDSRYLVILLNNIGDLIGDIVLPTADFFASLSTSALLSGDQSVVADNIADVTNNAVSTADTGLNAATGTTATIESGQANSGVDLHNFINQNSLGGRPVCFIVSVGGKWDGHVVGLPKNFSEESTPFGKIICGSGGASGTKVTSLTASTTNYAKILNNAIVEATTGSNSASGTIAKIKTGNADAFLQILNLVNQNIIGQDWVFALFTISGNWKGDLMFGSRAFWDAVNAQMAVINGQGSSALRLGPANVSIEKQSNPSQITGSSTVGYAIKIKNTGDPVYHAKLIDTIYDANHKPIHQQVWDLETIGQHEEIGLSYTVVFAASSTPGVYTNEAYLDGYDQNPDIAHNLGRRINSPIAKATLTVLGAPQQPFIAASEEVCEPYIKSYIKYGEANDPADVMKLQNFLIEHEHATGIKLTGLYDAATRDAVKLFQEKHAGEILSPWGIETATGYVYYTTQRVINETYCDGKRAFGFSPLQQEEIERYRTSLELRRLQGEVIPQEEINERVGQAQTETRLASGDDEQATSALAQTESGLEEGISQTAAAVQAVSSATTSVFNKIRSMIGSIFGR